MAVNNCKHSPDIFLQTPGPLAELTFWRERSSALCALSDQLKQPMVKKILEVITRADADIVQIMEETVAELTKYRLESDDNLRFLSTLERHFKVNFINPFLLNVIYTDLLAMNIVTTKNSAIFYLNIQYALVLFLLIKTVIVYYRIWQLE